MRARLYMAAGVSAVVTVLSIPSLAGAAAEPLDLTHCYSGTFTMLHDSKAVMPAGSWAQNGIIMSHTPSKVLDQAVVHCEGIQRGAGPDRSGYALCKIVDGDGDMIIADAPYSGFTYDLKFVNGSGKWKGVKGALRFDQSLARSKPGKGAMPGTYQGCERQKGSYELSKE